MGRSRYPCHGTYAGNAPFSELETQNLRDFVLSKNGTIKIYLTLHSFGKVRLYSLNINIILKYIIRNCCLFFNFSICYIHGDIQNL